MNNKAKKLEVAILVALILLPVALAASPMFVNLLPDFPDSSKNNMSAEEDQEFLYLVEAYDADSDHPLEITHDAHDPGVGFYGFKMNRYNATAFYMNFTPTNDDVGNYEFTLIVRDSNNNPNSLTTTINFTVNNTNDEPFITLYNISLLNETELENYLNTGVLPVNYTGCNDSNGCNNTNDETISLAELNHTRVLLKGQDIDVNDILNFSVVSDPASLPIYNMSGPTIPGFVYQENKSGIYYYENQGASETEGFFIVITNYSSRGLYNITATFTDSENEIASLWWEVNITNTNRPPIFNASNPIQNQTLVEDTSYPDQFDLDNHFYDYDLDDTLVYAAQHVSGPDNISITINPATHAVTFTPDPDFFGVSYYKFTVSDGYDSNESNVIKINVTNQNDPPTLDPLLDQFAYVDVLFSFDISNYADDPDGQPLIYYDNVSIFDINANTGLISFTPILAQAGNYTVGINVSDGTTNASGSFILQVVENTAPTLDFINDQTIVQDIPFLLTVTATDPDMTDVLAFRDNTGLFDIVTTNTSYAGGEAEISVTVDDCGIKAYPLTYTLVTITVNDSNGAEDSQVVRFNLTDINNTPSLDSIGNQQVKYEVEFTFDLTATDADNCESLTYTSNGTAYFDNFTITGTGTTTAQLSFTPNSSEVGDHKIQFNVTDSAGLVDTETIIFTVTANAPPLIDPIGYVTGAEDELFEYQVIASDPDPQDTLTYSDNTTLFDINPSTGLISFTPDLNDVDNYTINISVFDGELTNWTIMYLQINETDDTPYFDPALSTYAVFENNISEDNQTVIIINATDEEGAALVFNVTFLNFTVANGTVNDNSSNISLFNITSVAPDQGKIDFTPTNDDVGEYYANFTVSDGNTEGSEIVHIIVYNVNDAPIITGYTPTDLVLYINENDNLTFFVNYTDVDYNDSGIIQWRMDDLLLDESGFNETSKYTVLNSSLFHIFNYTTAGIRNISINISNFYNETINDTNVTIYESAIFSWEVNVTNVNRPPTFGGIREDTYDEFFDGIFIQTTIDQPGTIRLDENNSWFINGTYTSSIIEPDGNYFHEIFSLNWTEDVFNGTAVVNDPLQETDVYFRMRTSNSTTIVTFAPWSDPIYTPGEALDVSNSRFIQYQAVFTTNNTNLTRRLHDVTVLYGIANHSTAQTNYGRWMDLSTYFTDLDTDDDLNFTVVGATDVNFSIEAPPDYRVFIDTGDFIGEEEIYFLVDDGELSARSNNITLNVTGVPPTPITTPSGGGGGGGGGAATRDVVVETEVFTPIAFRVLSPGSITTYENDTIRVPVQLVNEGFFTLNEIRLGASATNDLVSMELQESFIPIMRPGEIFTTELLVTSFKTYGYYEITIQANVSDPDYSDSARIYVNSLEKGTKNSTQINTKISFAEDLLRQNPTCLELNEFVKKAKEAVSQGNTGEAEVLLDSVIEGCNYLIASSSAIEEEPLLLGLPQRSAYLIGGVAGASLIAVIIIAAVLGFSRVHAAKTSKKRRKKK